MNANELADELDKYKGIATRDAATMLRQQAKELDEAGHMIGVLREYISDLEKGLDSSINLNKAQAERQAKELTDEEIWKLWVKHLNDDIIVFARAILRKAQEK